MEKQDKDDSSNQTEYSEAAMNVLKELWVERDKKLLKSSARNDVLQSIWSEIVHESLERKVVLDTAWVDGTIYTVCNEYESIIGELETSFRILKPIAFEIISKYFDDYKEAISYCRYHVMTKAGRFRLGYQMIGEEW